MLAAGRKLITCSDHRLDRLGMEFRSDDARMRTRCDGIEQGCQSLVIKRLVARLRKLFSFLLL